MLFTRKMLISIHELISKFNLNITGIVHIGAHECEELSDYLAAGVKNENIYWFEAQHSLVKKCQQKFPSIKIFQATLSDTDNNIRNLIITNNGMSSSLLELKEHLVEHPYVFEIRRDKVLTVTFEKFVRDNKISLEHANFLNLDIQGHELAAMKGMGNLLKNFHYIYTEVNVKELYAGCALLPEIRTFLAENGFKMAAINMSPHGWGDAFFIRD